MKERRVRRVYIPFFYIGVVLEKGARKRERIAEECEIRVWLHVCMSLSVCWRLGLPAIVKDHARTAGKERSGSEVGRGSVEEKARQIWSRIVSNIVWKIDVDDGGVGDDGARCVA